MSLAGRSNCALTPDYTSPLGVEVFNSDSSIDPTGTWSLMSRAGPTLYIAGMRGIHASNGTLAAAGYPRVRLAFENMQYLAKLAGTDLVNHSLGTKSKGDFADPARRRLALVWSST